MAGNGISFVSDLHEPQPMQLFNLIIVVFCAMAIPLNFIVAFVIVRERLRNNSRDSYFRSSFFDLVLIQLLIDPPVLLIFFIFYVMKSEPPISDFLFNSAWSGTAGWSYYCLYLALYWKITGIVLITLQRLCACCYSYSDFTKFLDAHPKTISGLCLIISPIVTGILWATSPLITYNNVEEMALVLDHEFVTRNTALAAALVTACIGVSGAAYGRIYFAMRRMMRGSGVGETVAMRAQLRMTLQGFAQVVCALCFIDIYFLIVVFGEFPSSEDVETMRRFYHIFYFTLSALNPISLIILSDKTREALFCLTGKKKRRQTQITLT